MTDPNQPTLSNEDRISTAAAEPPQHKRRQTVPLSSLVGQGSVQAVFKLDPRSMVHNPVMFVTEIGSVISTVYFMHALVTGGADVGFLGSIAAFLWFTVLFANFAEAVAEGRGKAQAAALRRMKTETMANRIVDGQVQVVPASQLHRGDIVEVCAGEAIPSDGEVIEGIASVDESAITGESAPVIRESGGDRSAVTGGTRVLSDEIKVRISSEPGQTFLDHMIALVEGASRQKTPNEIALNILLAGLTFLFVLVVMTLQCYAIYSGEAVSGHRPDRPPRLPDAHDHRRPALRDRHRRNGPARPAQRARHVGPRRGGGRRREHAPAGQDGHDNAREPPGGGVHTRRRLHGDGRRRCGAARVVERRDAGGPLHRCPGKELRVPRQACQRFRGGLCALLRPDADERHRLERAADPQGSGRRRRGLDQGARRRRSRRAWD